jgi:hypothetical protein
MTKRLMGYWFAGLALVYLAFIWLTWNINHIHMHPDEYLVYFFTRRDLSFLWWYLGTQDTHPPLWFSSFWVWRQLTGDAEFVGRFYSVLLGLVTLALVYRLGKRWFVGAHYGLFAVILLLVNAFFVYHTLEIRPYSLLMLLATASMWTFQRWLRRQTWRTAFFYGATLAAMLYVHYFLFVLILAQVIYFFLTRRPQLKIYSQAVGAAAFAFVLWLPWMPSALNQVSNLRQTELVGGNQRGVIGAGTTTVITSWQAVQELAAYATNGQMALYALILVIGTIILWRQAAYRLALVWALGAPALSMVLNIVIAIYTPRYVVYMVIGLGIAAGAALAAIRGRVRWLALLLVAAISLWAMPTQLPDRTPYRDLYRRVSAEAKPEDVIFFDEGDADTRFIRWQIDHYLSRDLRRNRVSTLDEAKQQRRVWFATNEEWHYNPEVRKHFAELEQTHPLQTVIGDCTSAWCYLIQLMEAPPFREPVVFGGSLPFWGADVDAETGGSIDVRLWWKAEKPPQSDYSIGLHLLDAGGNLVAQIDRPIRDQYLNQDVQTSQMEPGRIYIDVRTLDLPPELPAGNYQLTLVVYQPWDGVRLTLADGSDTLVLDRRDFP